MLSIPSCYVNQIPHIKFYIVGRLKLHIHSGLRLVALRPTTEVLTLHDIDRFTADGDIRLFFGRHYGIRSDSGLSEGWPGSSDLDILCDQTASLFIYASTAVKFIGSDHHVSKG